MSGTVAFEPLSRFERGVLCRLLSDAYALTPHYEARDRQAWQAMEDFFFDNPAIGDAYCAVTTLCGEPIGFVSWDPRRLPGYAVIGHNCVASAHKGKGYGVLQLRETLARIARLGAKKVYVSTNADLIPAQRMYERVGFERLAPEALEPWQHGQGADVYYGMTLQTDPESVL